MHIPAVRLGLWCLYCAASVAAPLVVEAGGGTFSSSWQGSAAKGLAGVSPEGLAGKRSGGCLPRKVWQVSPQKGLADVSPERSGGCLPREVWRMSPQKGLADVSPEGLAGVRRRGIGSDLPGGIGSDLPGLNAQGELMSARTLSRLFPAPGCGALRWRRQ